MQPLSLFVRRTLSSLMPGPHSPVVCSAESVGAVDSAHGKRYPDKVWPIVAQFQQFCRDGARTHPEACENTPRSMHTSNGFISFSSRELFRCFDESCPACAPPVARRERTSFVAKFVGLEGLDDMRASRERTPSPPHLWGQFMKTIGDLRCAATRSKSAGPADRCALFDSGRSLTMAGSDGTDVPPPVPPRRRVVGTHPGQSAMEGSGGSSSSDAAVVDLVASTVVRGALASALNDPPLSSGPLHGTAAATREVRLVDCSPQQEGNGLLQKLQRGGLFRLPTASKTFEQAASAANAAPTPGVGDAADEQPESRRWFRQAALANQRDAERAAADGKGCCSRRREGGSIGTNSGGSSDGEATAGSKGPTWVDASTAMGGVLRREGGVAVRPMGAHNEPVDSSSVRPRDGASDSTSPTSVMDCAQSDAAFEALPRPLGQDAVEAAGADRWLSSLPRACLKVQPASAPTSPRGHGVPPALARARNERRLRARSSGSWDDPTLRPSLTCGFSFERRLLSAPDQLSETPQWRLSRPPMHSNPKPQRRVSWSAGVQSPPTRTGPRVTRAGAGVSLRT